MPGKGAAAELPSGLHPCVMVQRGITTRLSLVLVTLLLCRGANAAAPPNDLFANRLPFTPGVAVQGALDEATPDTERPDLSAGLRPSVWFEWTPDVDGQLWLELREAPFGTGIEVYLGETLASLAQVPRLGTVDPIVDCKAGLHYSIAIDGDGGSYQLESRFDPLAAADAFADRTILTGEHIKIRAAWRVASVEIDEGLPTSAGSLWWSWTAPADGVLVAYATNDPPGSIWSPRYIPALIGGTPGELTGAPVLPLDPFLGYFVEAGHTYSLRLLVRFPEDLETVGKDYVATFDRWPIQSNDNFNNRNIVTGEFALLTGDDHASSLENGEPNHGLISSLWWEWTAPSSGMAELQFESGDPGGAIRLYGVQPFNIPGAVPLAAPAAVVEGGRTYYICMGSPWPGGTPWPVRGRRTFSLRLSAEIPPLKLETVAFYQVSGLLLALNGPTGAKVDLAVSTNLVQWSPWTSVVLDAPRIQWLDPEAARQPLRFFKASIQP